MNVGYKRCGNWIVKLKILGQNNESRQLEDGGDPNYAKYRCSKAKVLKHIFSDIGSKNKECKSDNKEYGQITYNIGRIITISNYDTRTNHVCSSGIHYFKTLDAAINYTQYNLKYLTGNYKEYTDDGKYLKSEWLVNGQLHRLGGLPALSTANGHKEWWVNGQLHRLGDLPAIEWSDGTKEWWVNDKRHRDNGLPAIEWSNGNKEWWVQMVKKNGG